ncbi:DUF445 family protein [Tuwongella immobilis]|uniref:DUF445 domain-containing protein n=1 Tax=Tuwongella immobilis TaxID=692036 RepID=A0A6C2YQH6_9BACT|nr:DUF445 family protein [Tuwongella immobilis]VIP03607.1 Uncharacterized protein OS=Clostridium stercorarium subsp. stercorarium (strain ATCC 35414 / DSM 8532 / NCIMB 11754) GN=Cst_c12800 PE=4 SV=1: DUF445 [Tuwongella immobilis]VTS04582.1 Uncharacterized protein OS=Clostridium stercorarium subsp. stercorarium (strain ATCC 35414 / DSM 8532 / NCIMB 11754) GN=Cst_c12800 PE=4 SV=1: DUF445 [Tuwongella immobilis]
MNAENSPTPIDQPGKLRSLWRLARTSPHSGTRLFALAELVCFPVSLLTIVALLTTVGLRWTEFALPSWWTRIALPLLCTGAVGYLTNYVAVRMLFEPYSRSDSHWLTWLTLGLWRQGLVPARKEQLAESVGLEVAQRLLTPKAITEEITKLVNETLDDPSFRANLRRIAGPVLREQLPGIIHRLGPDLQTMATKGLAKAMTREQVKAFLTDVVEPWLQEESNRDRVLTAIVDNLRKQSPRLVGFMRQAAQKYVAGDVMKSMMLNMAESSGMLDWDSISRSIGEQLGTRESRAEFAGMLDGIVASLSRSLDEAGAEATLEQLRTRAGGYLGQMLEGFLAAELPDQIGPLLESDGFWNWLHERGIPALKPAIMGWLEEHGVEVIGKRFDVAGRVRTAITAMDVRTVHQMVDSVATEQLGAIQVLGFVLGLMTGIPLLLLL